MTMITNKNMKILESLYIITINGMGPESIAYFSQFPPYLQGSVPQENWTSECPVWLLWSTWETDLTFHLMYSREEYNHFHLAELEGGAWFTIEKPFMSDSDWRMFKKSTCQRGPGPPSASHN